MHGISIVELSSRTLDQHLMVAAESLLIVVIVGLLIFAMEQGIYLTEVCLPPKVMNIPVKKLYQCCLPQEGVHRPIRWEYFSCE
jgi:hypothetical protein